ncbi:MAG: twitch domain-containing radical SAM protein [Bdellovibrionaceae bacterium]|nr:twitch domain-containing radical SAM protein [Bdellovibrionales bacterium]MCB9084688.1 twitch domain-containing radical SAM protein [Pseudobdellovibrionaceae bacterium]
MKHYITHPNEPEKDYQFWIWLLACLAMDQLLSNTPLPPTFCLYPWTQLATSATGRIRLCCHTPTLRDSSGSEVTLCNKGEIEATWNGEAMRAVRRSILNGQLPDLCRRCKLQEKQGLESRRLKTLRTRPPWTSDVEARVQSTHKTGYLPFPPASYDLRLGNVCNLKCVMCRPQLSTHWIPDAKAMVEMDRLPKSAKEHLQYSKQVNQTDYRWYESSDLVNYLHKNVQSIRQLYFAGGEPLLARQHWLILESCVAHGVAKSVDLTYDTNGTMINQECLQLWEQFNSLDLRISLDDLGEKLEYIRDGISFTKFLDLMSLLENWDYPRVEIRLLVTIQILNALDLVEICDWFWNQKWVQSRGDQVSIVWSFLEWPKSLSVGLLPEKTKIHIIDKVDKAMKTAKADHYDTPYYRSLCRLNSILPYAFSLWADEDSSMGEFFDFVSCLDQTRGHSWKHIFPELEELIE